MLTVMNKNQRNAILWLSEHEDCFVRGAPWQHAGSLNAMTRWSPAPVAKHMDTSGWQPVAVWNLTDEGRDVAAALRAAMHHEPDTGG